jgi:drug/metabolite transporter (DMT)-like permease
MRTAFLIAVVVLAGSGGEIAATHAMRLSGDARGLTVSIVLTALGRAFRRGWMWIGIGMMALAFFSLLDLLSREEVSYAIPLTALSYVAGALGAKLFLGEEVSPLRWLGVLLVCVGAALVSMS